VKVYPVRLISRIKGAMRIGLKPKQLAYLTGIPLETIKSWRAEDVRATVVADPGMLDEIRVLLLKEN
jgi:hypothetical protein